MTEFDLKDALSRAIEQRYARPAVETQTLVVPDWCIDAAKAEIMASTPGHITWTDPPTRREIDQWASTLLGPVKLITVSESQAAWEAAQPKPEPRPLNRAERRAAKRRRG